MGKRKRNQIDGQFNARLIEMLESPAWRVLSQSAHRVFDRICIELAHHGGNDNGRLPVTYEHFVEYGIDRQSIPPAIRELVALGFIDVTRKGKASASEYRYPTLFGLTCIYCLSTPSPIHKWRRIKTLEEAHELAQAARRAKDERVARKSREAAGKNKTPGWKTCPVTGWKNHPTESPSPGWKSHPTIPGWENHPTSISRGGSNEHALEARERSAPLQDAVASEQTGDPDLATALARLEAAVASKGTAA